MKNKNKSFEEIYMESNLEFTRQDRIELLSDFINKMKNMINQGQFIINELEKEIEKWRIKDNLYRHINHNRVIGL